MSIFVQPVSNRLELLSQLFLGAGKWMDHKLNRGHLDLPVAQQSLLLCSWLAAAKLYIKGNVHQCSKEIFWYLDLLIAGQVRLLIGNDMMLRSQRQYPPRGDGSSVHPRGLSHFVEPTWTHTK